MVTFTLASGLTSGATAMNVITEQTATDATYRTMDVWIFDDSTALNTYTTANTGDAATAATTYTDGYAAQFVTVLGTSFTANTWTTAGCIGGTETTPADGATAIVGSSCAVYGATYAAADASGNQAVTYAASYYTSATSTSYTDFTGMTPVTIVSQVLGFDTTWKCASDMTDTSISAAPAVNVSVTCSRFLPKETDTAPGVAAADLRVGDAELTGALAYGDSSALTWVAPSASTYTWAGAAQLASAAAAAAVVALTF